MGATVVKTARHQQPESGKSGSTVKNITKVFKTFMTSREMLKMTFATGFLFASTMMASLGLSISVGNLSGNVLLNFTFMGLADLAAKSFRFVFLRYWPAYRRLLTTFAYG